MGDGRGGGRRRQRRTAFKEGRLSSMRKAMTNCSGRTKPEELELGAS